MEIEEYAGILYDNKTEKYYIIKEIGNGATSFVYLCKTKDNSEFAVKIFTNPTAYLNEVEILRSLNSKHIVKLITFGEGSIERGSSLETFDLTSHFSFDNIVQFCILEYLPNGDLFNYIFLPHQGFSERISKIIFLNLLEAIECCHDKGIIHGDIKLENILLSTDFSIKLIDFGFSKGNNEQFIYEVIGTRSYSSPEMFTAATNGYDGKKSDVFSLGVVLFALVIGYLPFETSTFSDQRYKLIIKNKYEEFWKKIDNDAIGENFKDLVCRMLCFNPNERIKLSEIKSHIWLNEKNDDQEDDNEKDMKYQKEFAIRKEIVDNCLKKENYY